MKLRLTTDHHGNLTARQARAGLSRFMIGLPLLGFGSLSLYGVFAAPILAFQDADRSGLPNALAGSFVFLIFAALTLAMGWWLVFSRHWIALKPTLDEVVEVSDWRIGRKETRTPLQTFCAVRLAVEELSASSRSRRAGTTHVQMIRLLASKPDEDPSLEIGWLDKDQRASALTLAEEVAHFTHLPLEVVGEDRIALSPSEEEEEKELAREEADDL